MLLADRSRWLRGLQDCPRARYLEYEFMGSGIRTRALSIPLATGTSVHAILAELLTGCKEAGKAPSRDSARVVLLKHAQEYRTKATEVGRFQNMGDLPEQVSYVIEEQAALIEALGWAFYRSILDWLVDEFEIVDIEREEAFVAACTCGLPEGLGTIYDHDARGCEGVVLMSRPDLVTRRKSDQAYGVWDFKTAAQDLDSREYEHGVQFALGTLGVSARLGTAVSHYYIMGLTKGKREADRSDDSKTPLKKQRTALIYCYLKVPDPPFTFAERRWDWTSAKGFTRTPVWQLPSSDPNVGPIEDWVMNVLPEDKVKKSICVVGPHQRPEFLMKRVARQFAINEKDYKQRLGEANTWEDLDKVAPCSWDCLPYKDSPCQFIPICYEHPGWEEPLKMRAADGSPMYEPRQPHHLLEGQEE